MRYNYKFARINESGGLEYAPLPLVINGENVWTNIEAEYNALGFYEIKRTEMPEKEGFYYTDFWELAEMLKKEGYYYTDYWELSDNKIVQKWEEHEEPIPEPTEEEQYAEAARILLGEAE